MLKSKVWEGDENGQRCSGQIEGEGEAGRGSSGRVRERNSCSRDAVRRCAGVRAFKWDLNGLAS